jgi:hypothetical protein
MVGNSAIVMLVSFKKRMGAVTTGKWSNFSEDQTLFLETLPRNR